MKRVIQRNEHGCGVACVAMIASVSYRRALRAVFGKNPPPEHSTETQDIKSALRKLDVKTASRLMPFRGKRPADLKGQAILYVNDRIDSGHWIVWDYARQCLLDPYEPPHKRYRYCSYLYVEPSRTKRRPNKWIGKKTAVSK